MPEPMAEPKPGQRTLFEMGCVKRARTAADEAAQPKNQPRELPTRLAPALAARVDERERQVSAALANRPPPPPPRPVGRPRKARAASPPSPQLLWVKLQPVKVSGRQEHACTHVRKFHNS